MGKGEIKESEGKANMKEWLNDHYREIMLGAMLVEIGLLIVIVWQGFAYAH